MFVVTVGRGTDYSGIESTPVDMKFYPVGFVSLTSENNDLETEYTYYMSVGHSNSIMCQNNPTLIQLYVSYKICIIRYIGEARRPSQPARRCPLSDHGINVTVHPCETHTHTVQTMVA